MTESPDGNNAITPRELVELDRAEAMSLLAGATFGRVVFTKDALPAIRPASTTSSITARSLYAPG